MGYDALLFGLKTWDDLLQSDGFPTILFFPAGSKSFEPVSYALKELLLLFDLTPISCLIITCYWLSNWYSLWQITFEGERTVVELYKFLKKNAGIPFKLQRPTSPKKEAETTTASEVKEEEGSSDVKDELWGIWTKILN